MRIILSTRPENDVVETLRCKVEDLNLGTEDSVKDVEVYIKGKLKEIRQRVGGSRRLNNLMGYVRNLEDKENEKKARRLASPEEPTETEEEIHYRYSPAQMLDGKVPLR